MRAYKMLIVVLGSVAAVGVVRVPAAEVEIEAERLSDGQLDFLEKRFAKGIILLREEPRAPEGPTMGVGLTIYFRSGESVKQLRQDLSPLAQAFALDHLAWRVEGALPLDKLSDKVLHDIVYAGEVPVPDLADGPVARNQDAADTHRVREACARHGVTGKGVRVGIWDEAGVRVAHVEFAEQRARQQDGVAALSRHATHVCGTIAARGVLEKAKGMAPEVEVACFDWNEDMEELDRHAAELACTNHSYGPLRGWHYHPQYHWMWYGNPVLDPSEDAMFGQYEGQAYQLDHVIMQHPNLSVFVAAGNERTDGPMQQPVPHWVRPEPGKPWQSSTAVRRRDGDTRGGYDTLAGFAVAKNVICIGAIDDMIGQHRSAGDIKVTSFTSWGPTDDGRVKPDLVANGFQLTSTSENADDGYLELSGTSMATPAATGIGALLTELAVKSRKRALFADEMKAVLVHTAMSPFAGPSAQIGWGSIRADAAADVVADVTGTHASLIRAELKPDAREHVIPASASGGVPIRATLVWIDPPFGSINAREPLNAPTPVLVHDLNLSIEHTADPSRLHEPWVLEFNRLEMSQPAERAVRRINHVDNVERVDIAADEAVAGEYRIRVSVDRLTTPQPFALVVTGLRLTPP